MGSFGCGAHSSNLAMAAWAPGAPVWDFLRVLEDHCYFHNPMAAPSAAGGRFYFECYPHPAILGLFDLDRILQYKVHRQRPEDWKTLIGLLRSLTDAALPIRNICEFVTEDLRQNKANEDQLDSILCAYVAAYWWRFGIERSTAIGDLSAGCIVTPHSDRTLAALSREFGGRMNLRGTAASPGQWQAPADDPRIEPHVEPPSAPDMLPRCDWIYFATTSRWSGTVTRNFVAKHHLIVRSVYNSAGQRTANVQAPEAGPTSVTGSRWQGQTLSRTLQCHHSAFPIACRNV